jgi:hypothetical protein
MDGWVRVALRAMVGDAPQPGLLEPGLTRLADLLAGAFVLVIGGRGLSGNYSLI